MRKQLIILIAICFCFTAILSNQTGVIANGANQNVTLMIQGANQQPDVPARIVDGRTFVPLRFISEQMGADVMWHASTSSITIQKGSLKLELKVGSKQIQVNGQSNEMDTAPFIANQRTLVPLRFVSEYLGLRVGWEPKERLVLVSQPIQIVVNGYTLPKAFQPIQINSQFYFPVFELAKHLHVEVTEVAGLHKYSFQYEVKTPVVSSTPSTDKKATGNTLSISAVEEENDSTQSEGQPVKVRATVKVIPKETEEAPNSQVEESGIKENEDEQTIENNGTYIIQTVSKELPSSEVVTIDNVKMVAYDWVDQLLGSTSEWKNQHLIHFTREVSFNELLDVSWSNNEVTLHFDKLVGTEATSFFLQSPNRLVIDLPRAVAGSALRPNVGGERVIPVTSSSLVEQVRIGQFSLSPMTLRVVLDLKKKVKVQFHEEDNTIRLALTERKPLVVIDPGHGGKDPGAIGSFSREANIVLSVSNKIVDLLKKDPDFDVIATRTTNVFISLDERVEIANNAGADIFLSVHANAINRSTVGGTETFIHYNADPTFGRIVHRHLLAATGLTDRGLKEAGFRVLRGTEMPAVLIEIAFVSNPKEEQLLNQPQFQDKVARAMYNAIREYEFGK